MLRVTRTLLTWLNGLNWLGGGLALAGAVLLLFPPAALARQLALRLDDVDVGRMTLIGLLAVVALVTPCAHAVFTRLRAIIDTALAGRPFVAANVVRLRTIGWALLGMQLLDLGLGLLSGIIERLTGAPFGWSPSMTGWLMVLFAFVLAHVFAAGTAFQEEVEATV